VNIKAMYLVSGMPLNGKTTFSMTFLNGYKGEFEGDGAFLIKSNPKAAVGLMLDELLLLFWNEKTGKDNRGNFSIPMVMYNISQRDFEELREYVMEEIWYFFYHYKQKELIIDGFLLDWFKDDIKREFADDFVICDVMSYMFQYYVDGIKFAIPRGVDKNDIKKGLHALGTGTLERYRKSTERYCVRPIRSYFCKKIIEKISPLTNYHYFDDLPSGNPNQQSLQKWKKLNMDGLLKGKTMLDIGCNSGYNCIMASYHAKDVLGIDSVLSPLKIASIYTNKIYQRLNVEYIHSDFFAFDVEQKFDVILCSSTMHYFVGKQKEFIDKCYNLLSDGGIFVLELGVVDKHRSTNVFVRTRADGALTQYPANDYLVNDLCKDFEMIYCAESVQQAGDDIPRFVYHFKKKG